MKPMRLLGPAVLALGIALCGCLQAPNASTPRLLGAPVDTTPKPPPPPAPAPILPLEFAGWDSTRAGETGLTRWRLGNESEAPFTMQWTLESLDGWPGLPRSGAVDLDPRSKVLIEVPVPVPPNTPPGMYELLMTVTRPGGIPPTTANGAIRVVP